MSNDTRFIVLGAGRQGTAAAYDLARTGESVSLADVDLARRDEAARKISDMTGADVRAFEFDAALLEGRELSVLKEHDVCISALPYHMNYAVAEACIASGTSMCDLGCDEKTLMRQLQLSQRALDARVMIVPDCGLAPGTSNVLAHEAVRMVGDVGGEPEHVVVYCGGLPLDPTLPLGYKLVFSLEGLLNNYGADVTYLEDGEIRTAPAMSGYETIEWPEVDGGLEAFRTAGGCSLLPWTYKDDLMSFEYKTLRYPGHRRSVMDLKALGLLDKVGDALDRPDKGDVVLMRATCKGGRAEATIDMEVYADEGFSAMERATGFGAAIVARWLPTCEGPGPGVCTPDQMDLTHLYAEELSKRGFSLASCLKGKI